MQCPTCGSTNLPGAARCTQCGAPLAATEPAEPVFGAEPRLAASGAPAVAAPDDAPPRKPTRAERRARGESSWTNGALILGTAVFAALALLGIWWNLRAPYVDPAPKTDAMAVTPFNSPYAPAPVASAPGDTATDPAFTPDADRLAGARDAAGTSADAAASGVGADVAAYSREAASAATAAATAAALAMPPPAPAPPADDLMTLLSRRSEAGSEAQRPAVTGDLPAHLNDNEPDAIAAAAAGSTTSAPVPAAAPAPASAATAKAIAAALAQCERYRWYEVIPKQQCIWAVCSGRWGRDGCPAGTNPRESR